MSLKGGNDVDNNQKIQKLKRTRLFVLSASLFKDERETFVVWSRAGRLNLARVSPEIHISIRMFFYMLFFWGTLLLQAEAACGKVRGESDLWLSTSSTIGVRSQLIIIAPAVCYFVEKLLLRFVSCCQQYK